MPEPRHPSMRKHAMTAPARVLPGQRTLIGCWDALTRISPGARLIETGGALAAVFPAWEPLNNAILLNRVDEASDAAAADELRGVYDQAGVPVWALWRPTTARALDTPDTSGPLGELKRDTTTLVMQAALGPDLRPDEAVLPASIAAVAALDDTSHMGVDDLGEPEGFPGLAGWGFLSGDRVVATAWTYLHDGDCGIFGVETLSAYRRRGFARRLMLHMLAEARSQGARTASLQSTRMGQPLYESLGFTPAGRYEEWIWQ
jgi:ribosomal protein S18 acetylase RimI-like enzyme